MKSLCVYCGSNLGARQEYKDAASSLGTLLATQGVTLVYGGGNVGLMGIVADAALAAGGRVIGVIPEALKKKEVAHLGLTELHVVSSMHERKMLMAELSDGFVALPGGIGTAEELFEVLTWGQLGIHAKSCGVLNVAHFFDGFIAQMDRMVVDGFLRREQLEQFVIDSDVTRIVGRLRESSPRYIEKLVDRAKVIV